MGVIMRGTKKFSRNKITAFTLAEMMVVMLIVSIVLAAMAPVMTTKNKVDNSSPWRYSPANSSDAYFGAGEAMRALIGQVNGEDTDLGKLIINNNATGNSHILFKSNNDILGDLYFNGTSLILGSRPSNSTNATYGANNISIGPNNWSSTGVEGNSNITIGDNAMNSLTTGRSNIGIGTTLNAVTTGSNNVAVGDNSLLGSNGDYNVAVGTRAYRQGTGGSNVIIGGDAMSQYSGNNNVVMGTQAMYYGSGNNNVAIGTNANYNGTNSEATYEGTTAVGHNAQAEATSSVAIGHSASVSSSATGSIAIGNDSEVTHQNSVAIGNNTTGGSNYSTAIGYNAYAKDPTSSGVGNGTATTAIGAFARATGVASIAIGASDRANNSGYISVGGALASGGNSIAIGSNPNASGNGAIAIGYSARATGGNSIAIGNSDEFYSTTTEAAGIASIALGYGAKANGYKNVAIGTNACKYVTGSNKTCIGAYSGPSSSDSWSSDSTERIFIGSRSSFNGGAAVLEVHNSTKQLRVDSNFRMTEAAVVVNGNLIVKGAIIGQGVYAGGHGGENFAGYDNRVYAIGTSGDKFLKKAIVPNGFEMFRTFNNHGSFGPGDMTFSDRRLKYVGKENTSGLEKIKQLKVFNYTFKKDATKTPHVGVIAQDLQKVFPNAVKKGADGFLTIRMEDMFYAVINAIKELDRRVTTLEKENKELKVRLDKLEAKLK